ncbi:hypothetical protein ABZP36_013665 [Zizania latifolia]
MCLILWLIRKTTVDHSGCSCTSWVAVGEKRKSHHMAVLFLMDCQREAQSPFSILFPSQIGGFPSKLNARYILSVPTANGFSLLSVKGTVKQILYERDMEFFGMGKTMFSLLIW